jgi:hypothetical protein
MSGIDDIFPEISGVLEQRPPAELVAMAERKRITGVLEAHDGPRRWELVLRGGEIVAAESSVEGGAIASFLALERGKYRLRQQLLLPDGTVSDRRVAAGRLEEQSPVDLVRTCERGGLNGKLRLKCGGRLVEALFDAGVFTTITLDGHQDVDVRDVWTWGEGEWAILALPALEPPPNPKDSGLEFLREFEVAAVSYLASAERKEAASWEVDDGDEDSPLRGLGARDRSVRVVYLDTAPPVDDPGAVRSRYSDTDVTAVVVYKRPSQRIIVQDTAAVAREAGDALELALAPATTRREREPAGSDLAERRPSRESPWLLVAIALVMVALIGVVLYLVSFLQDSAGP